MTDNNDSDKESINEITSKKSLSKDLQTVTTWTN